MSSFMSDKFLRYRGLASRGHVEITDDVACRNCGYNLRGLKTDTRCPECGTPMDHNILGGKRYGAMLPRVNVYLPDQPAARNVLRYAFLTAAIALAVLTLVRLGMLTPTLVVDTLPGDIVMLAASFAWSVSLVLLTPRAFDAYGRSIRTARLAARYLNFGWPIAFAGAVWMDLATTPVPYAPAMFALGQVLGSIGALTFFAILSPAAWDADRDDVGKRAMTVFWGALITAWLVMLLPRGIWPVGIFWVVWGFAYIVVIGWVIFMGIAIWCLFTMFHTISWPGRQAHLSAGRDQRIRETRDDLAEEVRAKIRRYPQD